MLTLVAILAVQETRSHTFVFVPEKAERVNLAGTFNNWSTTANPMRKDADGRTWRITLNLPFGKHQYKFVTDGSNWHVDPQGTSMPDGNGNTNSLLLLLPPDYARPARAKDGVIARSALKHSREVPDMNWDRGQLRLSFRARPGDVEKIEVCTDVNENHRVLQMKEVSRDELYANYVADLSWDRKHSVKYHFIVYDGSAVETYGKGGLGDPYPYVVDSKSYTPFTVPAWVEQSVVYQIFPDRFANGDPSNDPADVQPWDGKPTWYNRFGGDVAGIQKRLGHLTSLGVGAVYFNPIFKSPSNHRYDATDYLQVDPQFGTNAEFGELTRQMKAKGIRSILDIAFNHSAVDFGPFLDIRNNGRSSKYTDWYFIKSYPVEVKENPPYEAWFGFPSMPKLNVMNPETRDYLNGVTDFWKKVAPGVEGWRLDVANEVDMRYWRQFRKHVKSGAPQAWILGEHWGDGTPWLKGDQWDSVMNYQFRQACINFVAENRTKPSEFTADLMRVYYSYAPQVSRNLMNLLSSHDTERFLTLCKGDRGLQKLAAAVQMTWVGSPSVYYGEELGMEGGRDPDNRRGMEWSLATSENDMLSYYKKLIGARNASKALQSGNPNILSANDNWGTVVYERVLAGVTGSSEAYALVALNRSNQARTLSIALPAAGITAAKKGLIDIISGRPSELSGRSIHVSLAPRTAAILLPANSSYRSLADNGTNVAARPDSRNLQNAWSQ